MSRRSKRYHLAAEDFNDHIRSMFISSVRQAVKEGAETVVKHTWQDTSNAATQWRIGVKGVSEPRGTVKDNRATKSGGVVSALVGFRGENRSAKSSAYLDVVMREVSKKMSEAANKHIKGQRPEGRIFFFHPLSQANDENYFENARIREAGAAGVKRVAEIFQRTMDASIANPGLVRKHRLRDY